MQFTTKLLNELPAKATVYRVWDSLADPMLKGFGLTVLPSGIKYFVLRYTSPATGKRVIYKIGRYNPEASIDQRVMTLNGARAACRELREQINNFQCPSDIEKISKKQEVEPLDLSIRAMCGWYIATLRVNNRKSADRVEAAIANHLLPRLGEMTASEVTAHHIAPVIRAIRSHSISQADKVRSYLSAAFDVARKAPFSTSNSLAIPDFRIVTNPCELIERDKQAQSVGERFLNRAEIGVLWRSIDAGSIPGQLGNALKLLLSTGQRVEEVLQAEWSEFDIEAMVWEIPATRRKSAWRGNTSNHLVPLTAFHIELIEEARQYAGDSPYLYPGKTGKPRPVNSLNQLINRFCVASERKEREYLARFTPRDCRRTFKTLTGQAGLSKDIRDRLQGHSQADVSSKHYDKYDYMAEKKAAMQCWIDWLTLAVNKPSNVIQMRRA